MIVIPIFQMRQLRHREAVTCARSHSWEVAPGATELRFGSRTSTHAVVVPLD